MSNKIILKKSSVGAKVPLTTDLDYGEFALNYADGKLYFKNSSNTIQPLGIAYTKVIANTQAQINQGYIANTGAGSFTITLPANPLTGNYVIIVDDGNFNANPLYVGRNLQPIAGTAADLTLDIQGVSVTLLYDGGQWNVYTQVGASGGSGSGTEGQEYNYNSFPSAIIPDANNTYSLGNSSYKWGSVYATNYVFGDGTTQTTAAIADGTSITNTGGTITAQAGGLAGTTLKSTVVNSSLTSVGTITTGVWQGTAIANNKLANSSVTLNGTTVALGASGSISTLVNGSFTISNTSTGQLQLPVITQGSYTGGVLVASGNLILNANGNLWKFGSDGTMNSPYNVGITTSGLSIPGSVSGSVTLTTVGVAGSNTLIVPAANDTLLCRNTADSVANKTIDNSNTVILKSSLFTLQDSTDTTKQAIFSLSGITTATTRTYTLPNASTTLIGTAGGTFSGGVTLSGATNILGNSTANSTTSIANGATASGSTKSVDIGIGGLSGSTTTITLGSSFGTTVSANGTWTFATPLANSNLANSSVTINGTAVSLGGSATVTAAAGTLTGTTLNSTITASSLTSIGTQTILTVAGGATVTSNSATDKYLAIGTRGQLFDDGNLHLHTNSGNLWLNSLDGGDINLGLQSNSGSSKVKANNISLDAGYGSYAPIYGVRAWINCGWSGSVMTTRASGNLSVTRGAAGVYNFTFTTAMPDGNYAINATAQTPNANSDCAVNITNGTTPSTTGFSLTVARYGDGNKDVSILHVQVVR